MGADAPLVYLLASPELAACYPVQLGDVRSVWVLGGGVLVGGWVGGWGRRGLGGGGSMDARVAVVVIVVAGSGWGWRGALSTSIYMYQAMHQTNLMQAAPPFGGGGCGGNRRGGPAHVREAKCTHPLVPYRRIKGKGERKKGLAALVLYLNE